MFALLMGLKSVSPAQLQQLVQERQVTVIDVNSAQRWSGAHVPGARNLDHAAYQAADLPPEQATPLVFYCSNPMCLKAPQAARRAKAMGYTDVRVMAAGITGWIEAGLPTEAGAGAA